MSNLLVQNIKHTNGTTAQTVDTSGRTTVSIMNNDSTYRSDGGAVTQNLVQGLCKSWCQASQDAGNIIRDSFNTASITDTNTGIIDYNFTNNFSNDDYAGGTVARRDSGGSDAFSRQSDTATNEIRLIHVNGTDGTLVDVDIGSVTLFGDLA